MPVARSEAPPPALETPPELHVQPARRVRSAKLAALVAAAACAAIALGWFAVRHPETRAVPVVAVASVSPAPGALQIVPPAADPSPSNGVARAPDAPPAPEEAAVSDRARAELEHGPLRYAKTFERAQKALWTNRPAQAIALLQPLLAMPLSRRERAKAEHMMGDAKAKQGNKTAAARWYTRSLQLSQR